MAREYDKREAVSREANKLAWEEIASLLGIKYRVQGNGKLYCLCVKHCEKTASLVLYPHGSFRCDFYCYGCGWCGEKIDFLEEVLLVQDLDGLWSKLDEWRRIRDVPGQLQLFDSSVR